MDKALATNQASLRALAESQSPLRLTAQYTLLGSPALDALIAVGLSCPTPSFL
jgi:hypothetical protein